MHVISGRLDNGKKSQIVSNQFRLDAHKPIYQEHNKIAISHKYENLWFQLSGGNNIIIYSADEIGVIAIFAGELN